MVERKMKATKIQLKQLIKEEIQNSDVLLHAIEKLTRVIKGLDVSMDYLAASITGEDPIALGFGQSALGRAARRPSKSELKEIIKQELQATLDEKYVSRDCKKETGETGHCVMVSHETGKQKACYDDCDTARAVTHEAGSHPGKTCKEAHKDISHKKWTKKST